MQNVAVAPVPAVSRKMCESSKTPVPRRDKPPFERRCPSSQTGAEDCILAKPKYAEQTQFCNPYLLRMFGFAEHDPQSAFG